MESPEFWRDLHAQFAGLNDPKRDLRATESDHDVWIVSGGPDDPTQRQSVLRQFSALATRAAVAANLDGANPVDAWLNRLRDSPHAASFEYSTTDAEGRRRDGALMSIERLTIASAEFCVELETEAFARSRAPLPADDHRTKAGSDGMVGGPNLAAWLHSRMEETDLKVNGVFVQCAIDRKTIKRMLEGERVRPWHLAKLAKGLGVEEAAIPTD